MVDERLTSKAAQSTLREAGLSRQQTLDAIDQVAAEYILQTYFNQPDHAHDEANS
jgi:putative Holliday junction resolvase